MASAVPYKLKHLSIKRKSGGLSENPCDSELQNLISCWRLHGVDDSFCTDMVNALNQCVLSKVNTLLTRLEITKNRGKTFSQFYSKQVFQETGQIKQKCMFSNLKQQECQQVGMKILISIHHGIINAKWCLNFLRTTHMYIH